jgi:hypothetical protein
VLDDAAAEVGRVLDQRLAGDLADQVLAGHAGLVAVVELGHLERLGLAALGEHHQRLGRARPHARLALDAVVEAQHAALVVDQIEDVGRAHRDAGVAAGAAVVVDVVDEDARPGGRRGGLGPLGLARAEHGEQRHDRDGQPAQAEGYDPGHLPSLRAFPSA